MDPLAKSTEYSPGSPCRRLPNRRGGLGRHLSTPSRLHRLVLGHGKLAAACLGLAVIGSCLFVPAPQLHAEDAAPTWGPLAHQFQLTLEPGERYEVAGPLAYTERTAEWERWALSPFFGYARNPELDVVEFDVLYPLITYDRFGEEYKLRLLLLTTFTGGHNQEGGAVRRFTLFPFFFRQRSPDPAQSYTAVLPFHGRLKDRLFRDEVRFTLFPLYIQSRKRDVVTDNYLFPLVHVRHGDGLKGWQVWPLVGHETKTPVTRTNEFGDVRTTPGHVKSFLLWPILFRENLGIGSTNPENHRIVFPLYSQLRSPARDATTWLWPFFNVIHDRGLGYREWQAPWPIVVFARGPGKTANRVLPFYSRVQTATSESRSLLWPVYRSSRVHAPPLSRARHRLLFFLYSDLQETNLARGTFSRRTDVWPLFSIRRDHEGRRRVQALALLEPILPGNKSIERSWSPLWSLYRHQHAPDRGASSTSVLWNLYRQDRTPESRKISFLFGLFQYQSNPDGRRLRVCFLPLNRTRPARSAPAR